MFITRQYHKLLEMLPQGRVLLIFGPRQVGKTTLVKKVVDDYTERGIMLNGDDIAVREILGSQNKSAILDRFEGYNLVVIDEAQRISNIGLALKMLIDSRPELKIIATGSSSFELLGQVGEPLTGRKRTLMLYPIWSGELLNHHNRFELDMQLENQLIYGFYPRIITATSTQEKEELLREMVQSYLLKDILDLDKVKSSVAITNLLRMLAFQVGRQVSYNELSNHLGIDVKTVSRYLDLFEKTHIIIRLTGFSRNLRNEINTKSKYYFYDNGIRNALIANFNPLNQRDDVGMLWENHLYMERLKKRSYQGIIANQYFWRTWAGQEIDLLEEREGKLFAYEFKWKQKKVAVPGKFLETYPNGIFEVVNRENYLEFIL